MPPRGTDNGKLLDRIRLDDGLPMRQVKEWTPSKLTLLSYYLPEFAKICERNAHGWYFFDGFAGNGANDAGDIGGFMGSALIGVTMEPAPRRAVLVEWPPGNVAVLRERCASLEREAVILEGDCNLPDRRGACAL